MKRFKTLKWEGVKQGLGVKTLIEISLVMKKTTSILK